MSQMYPVSMHNFMCVIIMIYCLYALSKSECSCTCLSRSHHQHQSCSVLYVVMNWNRLSQIMVNLHWNYDMPTQLNDFKRSHIWEIRDFNTNHSVPYCVQCMRCVFTWLTNTDVKGKRHKRHCVWMRGLSATDNFLYNRVTTESRASLTDHSATQLNKKYTRRRA